MQTRKRIDRVLEAIERHRIDRRSYVAVFGGGAVIDAVGFASSTAHRGVRLAAAALQAMAARCAELLAMETGQLQIDTAARQTPNLIG